MSSLSLALKVQVGQFIMNEFAKPQRRKKKTRVNNKGILDVWEVFGVKEAEKWILSIIIFLLQCWLRLKVKIPYGTEHQVYCLKPPSLNQLLFQNRTSEQLEHWETNQQTLDIFKFRSVRLIWNTHHCFGLIFTCLSSLQSPVSIL